jgi:hypothetical protein
MLVHVDNYVRDKSGHIANILTKKSAMDCRFRAATIAGLEQQALPVSSSKHFGFRAASKVSGESGVD